MSITQNSKATRLAMMESFMRIAAENPDVDFSKKADESDSEEYIDIIRNIEVVDTDSEMEGKRGLFQASW